MPPFTFIFIGRSGCGKGTQAELLKKHLSEKYGDNPIFYLETGERFRAFITGDQYSNQLAKKVYELGDRQPDFLAVWMWSHILVDSFTGTEHLIIDGTPRSLAEALSLDTALKFYKRKAYVIYLDISREEAIRRLQARGRFDDTNMEKDEKRLDWFERDVLPAVEYLQHNQDYRFLRISGEQSVEAISAEILLGLDL